MGTLSLIYLVLVKNSFLLDTCSFKQGEWSYINWGLDASIINDAKAETVLRFTQNRFCVKYFNPKAAVTKDTSDQEGFCSFLFHQSFILLSTLAHQSEKKKGAWDHLNSPETELESSSHKFWHIRFVCLKWNCGHVELEMFCRGCLHWGLPILH